MSPHYVPQPGAAGPSASPNLKNASTSHTGSVAGNDDDLDVTAELTADHDATSKPRRNSFDFVVAAFKQQEAEAAGPPSPQQQQQEEEQPAPARPLPAALCRSSFLPRFNGDVDPGFEDIELGLYPNAVGTGIAGPLRTEKERVGWTGWVASWFSPARWGA